MKVAIVSRLLPPAAGGQAVLLYRLLKDVPAEDYCFISTVAPVELQQELSGKLPGKYFTVSDAGEMRRGQRFGLPILREAYNLTLGAYLRARQIAEIVRKEKCDAILSCSSGDDLFDVPAGFYASRIAGVGFYAYMFDTYSHMWVNPQTRFLGRWSEPHILRRAAGIIVTNESVRELLQKNYGVDSYVIHNPCDLSLYDFQLPPAPSDGQIRIVYTGAVYQAHYDAIRNLLKAVEMLGRPNVKLHLYTGVSDDILRRNGIEGPVVLEGYRPASEIAAIQKRADVLFLPLAFHTPYPELIKVSSPSKVGEFLMCAVPVLVHAPSGSFLSKYFREHNCGVVVDREDPALLAEELDRLLSEPELRQTLTRNAVARAKIDFDLRLSRDKLAQVFDWKINR